MGNGLLPVQYACCAYSVYHAVYKAVLSYRQHTGIPFSQKYDCESDYVMAVMSAARNNTWHELQMLISLAC